MKNRNTLHLHGAVPKKSFRKTKACNNRQQAFSMLSIACYRENTYFAPRAFAALLTSLGLTQRMAA